MVDTTDILKLAGQGLKSIAKTLEGLESKPKAVVLTEDTVQKLFASIQAINNAIDDLQQRSENTESQVTLLRVDVDALQNKPEKWPLSQKKS